MAKNELNKVQSVENVQVENVQVENVSIEKVEKPNTETNTKESALCAVSMSFKDAKKLIADEFNAEFVTPFNVLNFVNKNRTKAAYKVVFEKYLIQDENGKQRKLKLDDLLKISRFDENEKQFDIFCRLSSADKKNQSVGEFTDKDGKKWYFIPVPFSVNGFFSSMQSLFSYRKKMAALKAWENDSVKRAEHEKKQKEKLQKKVDELKADENFNGMTDAQIVLIARQITGVRVAL